MPPEIVRRLIGGHWKTVEAESPSGGSQTLEEVLTAGDDAGGLGMSNVGDTTIIGTDPGGIPLLITLAAGSVDEGGKAFRIHNPDTGADCLTVQQNGGLTLQSGDGSGSLVAVSQDSQDMGFVDTNSGFKWTKGSVTVFRTLNVSGRAAVAFTANAAPSDGALSANEIALWFDSTNGAAKLMIKAKTANGTVVTGEVALA